MGREPIKNVDFVETKANSKGVKFDSTAKQGGGSRLLDTESDAARNVSTSTARKSYYGWWSRGSELITEVAQDYDVARNSLALSNAHANAMSLSPKSSKGTVRKS